MSEQDDLEPTPEELAEAEALRRSLEAGGDELLTSLKSAWEPADLDPKEHEAILSRALQEKRKSSGGEAAGGRLLLGRAPKALVPKSPRGVVIRVFFGATAALAVAAAVLVYVRASPIEGPRALELRRLRSTQELFDKPFETSAASARVDRIAMARASDLRENRFARWGVR